MKTYKILFTLLFFAFGTALIAQNADEKQNEKKDKKVVIIKKTIDEDGNEVVEKIIKKGGDEDKMIWISDDGNEFEFSNDMDFEFKKLGDEMILLGDDLSNLELIELDLENLEGLQETLKNINVEVKDLDGTKNVWIHGDNEGEAFEFKWEGEEMPENLKQELEEKGIHLEHFKEGDNNNFNFNFGHDNKAFLGVRMGSVVDVENIDGEETKTVKGESKKGAEILSVIEDSAAEAAGLKKGDIITSIDGKKVVGHESLVEVLGNYEADDEVKIDYIRDGKKAKTTAKLTGSKGYKGSNIWITKELEESGSGGENYFFFDSNEDGEQIIKSENIIIIKTGDGSQKRVEIIVEEDENEDIEEMENVEIFESNSLDLEMVNIFPNPTSGVLQIQFRGEAVPTKVVINDVSGKEVYSEELNNFDGNYNTQIDVSDAAKGTLLLSINQGKKTFTEKIILE